MTHHLELATHFLVTDQMRFEHWITSLDLSSICRSIDEYFDTYHLSFYKRGIFIKLINKNTLEIDCTIHNPSGKDTDQDQQTQCYRFPVPFDSTQMSQFNECLTRTQLKKPHPFFFAHFLNTNHLQSFTTIDQTRKVYKTKDLPFINILVDELSLLGTFVTFELSSNVDLDTIDNIKSDIEHLTKTLFLSPYNGNYVDFALQATEITPNPIDSKDLSAVNQ